MLRAEVLNHLKHEGTRRECITLEGIGAGEFTVSWTPFVRPTWGRYEMYTYCIRYNTEIYIYINYIYQYNI